MTSVRSKYMVNSRSRHGTNMLDSQFLEQRGILCWNEITGRMFENNGTESAGQRWYLEYGQYIHLVSFMVAKFFNNIKR